MFCWQKSPTRPRPALTSRIAKYTPATFELSKQHLMLRTVHGNFTGLRERVEGELDGGVGVIQPSALFGDERPVVFRPASFPSFPRFPRGEGLNPGSSLQKRKRWPSSLRANHLMERSGSQASPSSRKNRSTSSSRRPHKSRFPAPAAPKLIVPSSIRKTKGRLDVIRYANLALFDCFSINCRFRIAMNDFIELTNVILVEVCPCPCPLLYTLIFLVAVFIVCPLLQRGKGRGGGWERRLVMPGSVFC